MSNMIHGNNFALITARSTKNSAPDHFFISTNITDAKTAECSTQSAHFPSTTTTLKIP